MYCRKRPREGKRAQQVFVMQRKRKIAHQVEREPGTDTGQTRPPRPRQRGRESRAGGESREGGNSSEPPPGKAERTSHRTD